MAAALLRAAIVAAGRFGATARLGGTTGFGRGGTRGLTSRSAAARLAAPVAQLVAATIEAIAHAMAALAAAGGRVAAARLGGTTAATTAEPKGKRLNVGGATEHQQQRDSEQRSERTTHHGKTPQTKKG
jgi:hypothetical protein